MEAITENTNTLAADAAQARMILVARYTRSLRNKKDAHKKGYSSNPENFQDNEEVVMKKRLGRTDLAEAGIILDVANEKIVKNRYSDDQSFADVWKYFLGNYSQQINEWVKLEIAKQNAKQPTFTVG